MSHTNKTRQSKLRVIGSRSRFKMLFAPCAVALVVYGASTLWGTNESPNANSNSGEASSLSTVHATADDASHRPVEDQGHPLEPALQLARAKLHHLRSTVRDYSAVIVKRERINGELTEHQFMEAKIRNRVVENGRTIIPFSVYLLFRKPDSLAGREVIWVEGRNDDKLVAHEGGFKNLLTVKLRPDNVIAMFGQRYPITDIGIENLLVKLIEKGERDKRHPECTVKIFRGARVAERVCTLIQVEHPVQRSHFEFCLARIFIDDELDIPIRYAAWSWPESEGDEPVLEEEYTYLNLRTNLGLTDLDFDPKNTKYRFP